MTKRETLDLLIDRLARQVGKTAIDMTGEDKFNDKLDALKALTTLKSVKNRGDKNPDGGGIDEFAKLFGSTNSLVTGGGTGGGDPDATETDPQPDYEPTETDHTDGGVAGDLDGIGGEATGPAAPHKRNGNGVGGH